MTNFVEKLWGHAESNPESIALREQGRIWTYGSLKGQIASYAHRLMDAGITQGERVLLVAPSSHEFVVAYHGILATGAIAVTVNTMSTRQELEYFIEDSECSLAIAWHETSDAAVAAAGARRLDCWILNEADCVTSHSAHAGLPVPVSSGDGAVLLYTSGTTGQPKGAELTHSNLAACAMAIQETLQSVATDRVGTALPLFHVFGQVCVMGSTFWVGASLSVLRKFDGSELLKMAADDKLTVLSGVPTMWNGMLHAQSDVTRGDLENLRVASSGGAALPLTVAEQFYERFGCTVLDGYGLSETTGAAAFNTPDSVRKEESVGRALPGLAVAILDPAGNKAPPGQAGEIAIRGGAVMKGYWRRPEATAEVMRGEWFLTGDIGKQDSEGYLWIIDRKKDLVIRGGYNVYPREIEEVLYSHPDILEAAVIGIPDERLGEEIAAVIVSLDSAKLDVVQLREWVEKRLSAYKVPRIYQIVDELPKGSTGKILKRRIDREVVHSEGVRAKRPSEIEG